MFHKNHPYIFDKNILPYFFKEIYGTYLICALLVDNDGELLIDFDGEAAYSRKETVFFKPSGAWIHFVIDYLKAFHVENPENLFCASVKQNQIEGVTKGRFWLFSYEVVFNGLFDTRSYEYILCKEDLSETLVLDIESQKSLFQKVKIAKKPDDLNLELFDSARMKAEDLAECRKEEIAQETISGNAIKIGSRIEALRKLSNIRVRNLEDELLGTIGKEEEKLRRAIEREKRKTADKIKILEDKMKYVGTYALDAICLLDII